MPQSNTWSRSQAISALRACGVTVKQDDDDPMVFWLYRPGGEGSRTRLQFEGSSLDQPMQLDVEARLIQKFKILPQEFARAVFEQLQPEHHKRRRGG